MMLPMAPAPIPEVPAPTRGSDLRWPVPEFGYDAAEGSDAFSAGEAVREIVVPGRRDKDGILAGIEPEDEINEAAIAAYGADSVSDLINQIAQDLAADDDGPVILVNGKPATGIDEVGDLPAEALSKVQLMPKGTAARLGERPERRVINVQLKPAFRQATLNAERSFATQGKGASTGAEASFTQIAGSNRTAISARFRDVDLLRESDRAILPPEQGPVPYDLTGNVVSYPLAGLEIDPFLSAAAGRYTTLAGVPEGTARPSLADLARRANLPNATGVGFFRSLVPSSRNLTLNLTAARRLAPRTNLTINLNGDSNRSRSLFGTPSVALYLAPGSLFSPFSQAVTVARFVPVALEGRQHSENLSASAMLNQNLDQWNLSLSASFSRRSGRSENDRDIDRNQLQNAVNLGTISPFAPIPADYLAVSRIERTQSVAEALDSSLTIGGPLAKLPAGPVNLSIRFGAGTNAVETSSNAAPATRTRRSNASGQISLDIPILGQAAQHSSPFGAIRASLSYGLRQLTGGVGKVENHSLGLSWQPLKPLYLRAGLSREGIPAPLEVLNAPINVFPNVYFFDFVRNETATVSIISGGNPDLANAARRTVSISGNYAVLDKGRLSLSAEYTHTRTSNQISALPPLTADVQAAFADRFLRAADGRLIQVDSRPVSFERDDRKQFRWGFSAAQWFGKPIVSRTNRLGMPDAQDGPVPAGAPRTWRFNASLNHVWTLQASRLARTGLAPVDLLNGGAVGYGGGIARHTVQFNVGVGGKDCGFQLTGQWRAATTVRAGTSAAPNDLRYAARSQLDARFFMNLNKLFPKAEPFQNARLSLNIRNVLDSKERVTDSSGNTPRRYQPALLDPLGRTVTVSLRKTF